MYNYGDRSIPTYKTLLAGTNPTLAGEALSVLAANKQLNLKPEFFIEYISSEHEPIRKAAQRALQGRIRDLTAENIRMLLKTQVAEAKMLALRAVINLDREEEPCSLALAWMKIPTFEPCTQAIAGLKRKDGTKSS